MGKSKIVTMTIEKTMAVRSIEFDKIEIIVSKTDIIFKRLCCFMLNSEEYGFFCVPFGL